MARREPTFHAGAHIGAHDGSYPGGAAAGTPGASGLTRLVSTMQIVGSLLAVPLGLASGYSIYRANFSPETTCQTLRGNIIGMLDKNVDAATRRILVRRDVESFEQNCGSVDPDAHAAFKRLLAADLPKADKVTVAVKSDAAKRPVEAVRKIELRPAIADKPAAKVVAPTPAEPEMARQEAALSDTRWLAAVRQALVTHNPEAAASTEPAGIKPARAEAVEAKKEPVAILQPAWTVSPQPPAQPAPAAVMKAPQPDAGHPVPPAPIPTLTQAIGAMPAAEPVNDAPRSESWVAQIPLIGPALARGN